MQTQRGKGGHRVKACLSGKGRGCQHSQQASKGAKCKEQERLRTPSQLLTAGRNLNAAGRHSSVPGFGASRTSSHSLLFLLLRPTTVNHPQPCTRISHKRTKHELRSAQPSPAPQQCCPRHTEVPSASPPWFAATCEHRAGGTLPLPSY